MKRLCEQLCEATEPLDLLPVCDLLEPEADFNEASPVTSPGT